MSIIRYKHGARRSLFDELEEMVSSGFELAEREFCKSYPYIDIVEEQNGYKISADLPGMNKEDIHVIVERGVITIRGVKKQQVQKTERDRYYHFERGYGAFCRSFNLPSLVDSNSIDARYGNGVLEIFLRKGEEKKSLPLEIKVE